MGGPTSSEARGRPSGDVDPVHDPVVAPERTPVDEHGPMDPATAEVEVPGHGGWRRGVVGIGVGLVAGLLVRAVVQAPDEDVERGPGA